MPADRFPFESDVGVGERVRSCCPVRSEAGQRLCLVRGTYRWKMVAAERVIRFGDGKAAAELKEVGVAGFGDRGLERDESMTVRAPAGVRRAVTGDHGKWAVGFLPRHGGEGFDERTDGDGLIGMRPSLGEDGSGVHVHQEIRDGRLRKLAAERSLGGLLRDCRAEAEEQKQSQDGATEWLHSRFPPISIDTSPSGLL